MHLNEFRDTLERIKRLKDIQYSIDKEIEYICKSNGIIHNLKKIGFTVVDLSQKNKIALINYKIDEIDNKYYGIGFNLLNKEFTSDDYLKISKDELTNIKKILQVEK